MYPNCKLFPWIPPHTFPYVHSLPTRVPTLISRDSYLSPCGLKTPKPFSLEMTRTSLRENLIFNLYDQIFKPSKLPTNADFHLFKAGIEPKWEDPECAVGGKWFVIGSRKANLDTMWLETVKF